MQEFQVKHPDLACQVIVQHAYGVANLWSKKKLAFGCWEDRGNRLGGRLNAFFRPRLYLLDGSKRVRYLQPYGEGWERALSHVKGMLVSAEAVE